MSQFDEPQPKKGTARPLWTMEYDSLKHLFNVAISNGWDEVAVDTVEIMEIQYPKEFHG